MGWHRWLVLFGRAWIPELHGAHWRAHHRKKSSVAKTTEPVENSLSGVLLHGITGDSAIRRASATDAAHRGRVTPGVLCVPRLTSRTFCLCGVQISCAAVGLVPVPFVL